MARWIKKQWIEKALQTEDPSKLPKNAKAQVIKVRRPLFDWRFAVVHSSLFAAVELQPCALVALVVGCGSKVHFADKVTCIIRTVAINISKTAKGPVLADTNIPAHTNLAVARII